MTLLEFKRRCQGLSQKELGRLANVDASTICKAEKYGFIYNKPLTRLADALCFDGSPDKLLMEVHDA